MLRSVLAVVLGVVVGSIVVLVIEMIGHAFYRPPQLDLNDREATRAAIA